MNIQDATPGEVVTFYSYKGGTGRTMTLVNLAYLLADKLPYGQRILLLDWDLEAPGLHRYFHDRLRVLQTDKNSHVDAMPGLIDLFCLMKQTADDKTADASDAVQINGNEDERPKWTPLETIEIDDFILGTDNPNLHMIKAGLIDDGYSTRVNTFDWEGFYDRFPSIFLRFAEKLKSRYRYIFIDSRTGQTDTAGICTALMPEKLVAVFTPNRQSLLGMESIIRQAIAYRNASEEDMRPLMVFPLPSRVEVSQDELRATWRSGDKARNIEGYEPFFTRVLSDVYGLKYCHLKKYFDEVQIRHSPVYAFGEEIAVLIEKSKKVEDDYSLTRAYKNLLDWLEPGYLPWQHSEAIRILKALEAKTALEPVELRSLAETVEEGNALVVSLLADGNDGNAYMLAMQVSRLARNNLPHEQSATLNAMINLADIHRDRGEFQKAAALYKETLEICKQVFGNEHRYTLSLMGNLALTLKNLGELPAARALQEKVLISRSRVLGEEHPETLSAIHKLADTLADMGELSATQTMLTQALPVIRKIFGDQHPHTLASQELLNRILVAKAIAAAPALPATT
jgi:eukaryotic-like serine/threonine-protein kinase